LSSTASNDRRSLLLLLATGFIIVFDTWTGCIRCMSGRPARPMSCCTSVQSTERAFEALVVGLTADGAALTWTLDSRGMRNRSSGALGKLPDAVAVNAIDGGARLLVHTGVGQLLLYDLSSDTVIASLEHTACTRQTAPLHRVLEPGSVRSPAIIWSFQTSRSSSSLCLL
jgi:hypothetical protein